ncbi:MAG: hypothetical protein GJ676_03800 [Rhodobacteraceae bacterium]|nr:hypothetical protein [Paracoccaceae bacterium]
MITKKAIAAGAIAAALTASAAAAAQFELFGQAEGWNVFTKTDDKTCVIETRRDDLIVQMGVFANQEVGYIGVFTHEPDGVNASATGNFIVDFDGDVFAADEVIMEGNDQGYSGVYIKANNPNFISDLANKKTMKVIDTERVFTLDLAGTKAAMAMGRECIAAANS